MRISKLEIDDIAFKKKQIHSGWWGLSRETISLLYLRHNQFFLWDFLLSYPPSKTTVNCKKLKCDIVYYLVIILLQRVETDSQRPAYVSAKAKRVGDQC